MPTINALCRVFGLAESSSATVPTNRSASKQPKATVIPSGWAMRLTHHSSASSARSCAVDVNASAACS